MQELKNTTLCMLVYIYILLAHDRDKHEYLFEFHICFVLRKVYIVGPSSLQEVDIGSVSKSDMFRPEPENGAVLGWY